MNDLTVKVGPQVYRYYEGAIDSITTLFSEYKVKKILIVHGTISWIKAKPFLACLNHEKIQIIKHQYTGECSYYGAQLIADIVYEQDVDFILGVGGGKLADVTGYAAHLVNRPFGVIPTLASNCAPWTPLAVMYKENGEAEGKSEHFLRQAAFMITDPQLIMEAPISYFVAGLADTLAKWYESESILAQRKYVNEPFLQLAGYTAKMCEQAISEKGYQAIRDMQAKKMTADFVHLTEIVMATAGLVGGLGDKYARNAAAHAMHDAISKYIPASHQYLHGEKVAYGVLYQLALEEKWPVIDQLIPLYRSLKLPMSLHHMGIYPEDDDILEQLAVFIDSKEKVHLIPVLITKERLKQTILDLEDYIEGM